MATTVGIYMIMIEVSAHRQTVSRQLERSISEMLFRP
jgi:hypothetical protein